MKWMLSICALLFLLTGCQSQHEEEQVTQSKNQQYQSCSRAQSEMKQQGF